MTHSISAAPGPLLTVYHSCILPFRSHLATHPYPLHGFHLCPHIFALHFFIEQYERQTHPEKEDTKAVQRKRDYLKRIYYCAVSWCA